MKTLISQIILFFSSSHRLLFSSSPRLLFSLSPFLLLSLSPSLLLSLSPFLLFSQSIQFYREDIIFKMNDNSVTTDAIYHFCNVGDKEARAQLFYPFPANTMEQIDSLVIWNIKTNEQVTYRKGHSGVFFAIFAEAYGQAAYRVFFQQWLLDRHFKYILTSTETWGKALDFANFELQVPASLTLDSVSYPPDTSFVKENTRYFFWKKKDFMPDRDFELWF